MLFELSGQPLKTFLVEFLAKFVIAGISFVDGGPLNHLTRRPLCPRDLEFRSATRQQASLLHFGHVDKGGVADAGEFEAVDVRAILFTELQALLKV